jgi:hypothetical protein
MQCPNCHHLNKPQAKFCAHCGQPLPAAPPAASGTCTNCGRPIRTGARFCNYCGAPQQAPAPPPPTPYPPGYVPAPAPPPAYQPHPAPFRPGRPSTSYIVRHTLLIGTLAVGLLLALAGAFVFERSKPATAAAEPPPAITPGVPTPAPTPTADYRQAVVEIGYTRTGRFGLRTTEGNPDIRSDDNKLLTYSPQGETHNTRVWIDGETPIYGGSWLFGLFNQGEFTEAPHWVEGQLRSAWVVQEVEVAQTVSYVYGTSTGRVDTLHIKYVLTNQGREARQVGLRIMLDTLIGDNDGVPFVVPGQEGIVSHAIDLRGAQVPDFIQALEFPDLTEPGVIVHLTLGGADATRPDRLVISAWCDPDAKWDYYAGLGGNGHPLRRCGTEGSIPDSAVGLYFDARPLPPGESRTIITYYGLGGISSTESGNVSLSLTFSQKVRQGETFWVTALVTAPQAGQTVRLELPAGLSFAEGYGSEQTVMPGGDYTQVSWQVAADAPLTDGLITATLQPDGVTEVQSITVLPKGITR